MTMTAKEALDLWRSVTVDALKADFPDLTSRQFALLMQVYLTSAPHTVRGLARDLKMSKPAVTRALDRLTKYDYIRRKTDENDRRSVLVQRTIAGSVFLRSYGDMIESYAQR